MDYEKVVLEAFEKIEAFLAPKGIKAFQELEYEDLYQCHFSPLGLWIRNHLLKSSDALYQMFHQAGLIQKDDMSTLLIQLFYIRVRLERRPVTESSNVLHMPSTKKSP